MMIKKVGSVILSASLLFGNPVFAETNDELKARIEKLEAMVLELKSELAARTDVMPGEKSAAVSEESGAGYSGNNILKDITLHGFVDTSYTFNTNTPDSKTNSLRVFDTQSNSFMLNLTELSIEKTVNKESPGGFRVDLAFGNDAEVFGSSGLGSRSDEFDLWQAYGEFMLPYTFAYLDELDIKAGKMATLLGAEVIESKNNWNFSRSFLFGYAIPFNHTGVRVRVKPFKEHNFNLTAGIVNGWDNVKDNNKAKTLESQILYSPFDNLSLAVNGIFGSERDGINSDYRDVVDFVLTFKPMDKLTLMANYDLGFEKNGVEIGKNAQWDGVAGYIRYEILDWWALAGRGEWFHDRDGVRTGVASSLGVNDVNLWEFTVTNEFKIYKNLIFRVEFRHDGADHNVYGKDSEYINHQNTISGEVIAYF